MSLKRIRLLIWKEFVQLRRDPLLLRIMFIMPVLQLILFGYVVGADVKNLPTAVVDLDHSVVSRQLEQSFSSSGYFRIDARPADERLLRPLLDRGDISVAVVIPEGTALRLARGETASLGVIVDGSDSKTASVASGYAAQIVSDYNQKRIEGQGIDLAGPGLDTRVRVMFNPTLEAVNTMIPGLMATILMISMMSVMAQAVVRERERGTLEQMFVTPIGRGEYLIGKVTPYVLVAIAQMSLVALVGRYWFRVPFYGQMSVVFVGLLLFMFTGIGLGLLVSLVSRTRQQAQQTIMFILIPTMVLSGFIFPIESMPAPVVPITYVIPLRYALIVLRGSFIKGSGFSALAVPLMAMAVFSAVVFGIAIARFSKRLAE